AVHVVALRADTRGDRTIALDALHARGRRRAGQLSAGRRHQRTRVVLRPDTPAATLLRTPASEDRQGSEGEHCETPGTDERIRPTLNPLDTDGAGRLRDAKLR